MSKANIMLNLVSSYILRSPLENICSDTKSIGSKAISGIAIGILSLLSCGLYTIYIYKFFANRKAVNLQRELEKAIGEGNCEYAQKLFKKYPALKVRHDLVYNIKSDSLISLMLPLAAENGHLDMVKLLCENGAKLDASSRDKKTALERALSANHEDIAKYLIERGATVYQEIINQYLMQNDSNFDMIIYLVERVPNIIPEGRIGSTLGIAAISKYDEDPEQCKKLIKLLIEKGARLIEKDYNLPIPEEAKNFINHLTSEV